MQCKIVFLLFLVNSCFALPFGGLDLTGEIKKGASAAVDVLKHGKDPKKGPGLGLGDVLGDLGSVTVPSFGHGTLPSIEFPFGSGGSKGPHTPCDDLPHSSGKTPTVPTLPTGSTPSIPKSPSVTTPSIPTSPSVSTPAIPCDSTSPTPTLPAGSTLSTPTLPAGSTLSTPKIPSGSTLSTPKIPCDCTSPTPKLPTGSTPSPPTVPSGSTPTPPSHSSVTTPCPHDSTPPTSTTPFDIPSLTPEEKKQLNNFFSFLSKLLRKH